MKEKLHLSCYSMILPLKEKSDWLLCNGVYGAYDVIPGEEAGILREHPENLTESRSAELAARGHLTAKSPEEEQTDARLLSRCWWLVPYRSLIDLVLMPTYNCNFRCEYCFERQRLEKGQAWLSRRMTEETWEAIVKQMDAFRAQRRHIRNVFLYGGEPLLSANRSIVEKMVQACRERSIRIICVSNGYELDRFLDLLADAPMDFIQITVDGPAEVHDARRFLAGGGGSFERIMENVRKALDRGLTIQMRTNVNRQNLASALELPAEYARRGFLDHPLFRWHLKATIGCFEDDPANAISEMEILQAFLDRGWSEEQALPHCAAFSAQAHRIQSAFSEESYPHLYPAACGAESDMLVADPDGVLYTCWDVVSMEEYAVGTLDRETGRFLYQPSFAKWRNRTADRMPECRECPIMMICGGGCAIEAEKAAGSLDSGFCGSAREVFEKTAPIICGAYYRQTGKRELSASWYDLLGNLTGEERKILSETMSQREGMEILKAHMNRREAIFR